MKAHLFAVAMTAAVVLPFALGAGYVVRDVTTPPPPAPTVSAVVEVEGLGELDSLGERWMYVVTSKQNEGEVMDAAAALIFSRPPGRFVVQNCSTYSDSAVSPPLGTRVISECTFRRVTEKQVVKHYTQPAPSGSRGGGAEPEA